jgi:2-amino-4-hydroxy-6-hydroxymethyldihydropteridine diphosphokinase / dihydropteroate synthase
MQIYLGLGSNVGDRVDCLQSALELLERKPLTIRRVSPVVESPALLPENAPADWNRPYLNLVVECETAAQPAEMLSWIGEIESALGRDDRGHWAPRPIDIDILLWGREQIHTDKLTIPHPQMHQRAFVLTPLIALTPQLTIPGLEHKTLLQWSAELPQHIPLWMGVINVTPDSFSDGNEEKDWRDLEPKVDTMIRAGVHIIDVGGESTRPGATPVTPMTEWQRIEPVLAALKKPGRRQRLAPLISVDTYHAETARRALDIGADIINDVSGLCSPEMIDLAASSRTDWIAMHSLSIPVDRKHVLPVGSDSYTEVERWLTQRLELWDKAGLDLERIIFDPGVGFGKDSLQSLQLLKQVGHFRRHGLRILVGHSRKSFLHQLTGAELVEKDQATVGMSLQLCHQRVDILRVHNIPLHAAAYRGWSHLQSSAAS